MSDRQQLIARKSGGTHENHRSIFKHSTSRSEHPYLSPGQVLFSLDLAGNNLLLEFATDAISPCCSFLIIEVTHLAAPNRIMCVRIDPTAVSLKIINRAFLERDNRLKILLALRSGAMDDVLEAELDETVEANETN
jgi:hypothetical protein